MRQIKLVFFSLTSFDDPFFDKTINYLEIKNE